MGGYVRDDAGLRPGALQRRRTTAREPHSAIYARFGDEPGAHADIIPAVIASGGDFDLPRDGLVKVNNVQYQLAEGAGVLMDGTLIANREAVEVSNSPYTNLRYDFGVANADPWTVAVHVGNVVWGGALRLVVDMYTTSQANGNGGWVKASATDAHRYPATSGAFQASVEKGNVDLRRWVGLRITWTGGSDQSADIIAALHRA